MKFLLDLRSFEKVEPSGKIQVLGESLQGPQSDIIGFWSLLSPINTFKKVCLVYSVVITTAAVVIDRAGSSAR